MTLRIRTAREMIELTDEEAEALRERLRCHPSAQPVEETIAVAVNASTSVTLTPRQEQALLEVLAAWLTEVGAERMGAGSFALRTALVDDADRRHSYQ
jgi:hypothetical protein